MDRLFRLLAFVGGYLVASNSVSMAELTTLATDLLTNINTIAGALLALSPEGLSAARTAASKLKSEKPDAED